MAATRASDAEQRLAHGEERDGNDTATGLCQLENSFRRTPYESITTESIATESISVESISAGVVGTTPQFALRGGPGATGGHRVRREGRRREPLGSAYPCDFRRDAT